MLIPLSERILYEDNHLLVVNKLSSEIVQGDKTGDESLLEEVKHYLKIRYHKPGNVFAGLVHRIDRPVSGAVMYAKTSKALSRLTTMVRERELDKMYLAVVRNKPAEASGSLEHFLVKNEAKNKSYITEASRTGARLARLDYEVMTMSDSFCLLKVQLHTGRHHQIRAQLSAIGSPILGDVKYGDRRALPDASIALHAVSLSFKHPVSGLQLIINATPSWNSRHWEIFRDMISETYFR